ncbi:META domain-containing protein [Pedobacter glucosidilyticus]|uniref:META domain-containing protein n=1 Tax=Pedobacter glucosidilyticus TaxID=1122941 RepID=UPI0026EA52FA|nr:META domain-containing protein [Pedobacter glucosidilyticus]
MKKHNYFILLFLFIISACAVKKAAEDKNQLNGTWELNYISGPRIAFEGLYPNQKPQLTFDVASNKLYGNTSCNSLSGALVITDNRIDFNTPMALTKRFCEGQGEQLFLESLKKSTRYSVNENTLTFLMDDIAIMRFIKKP